MFPRHERISRQSIALDLLGDVNRFELSAIVINELRHRVGLKLSLGQRVALCVKDLSRADKQNLAELASGQGAQVINLIGDTVAKPVNSLPDDVYSHLRAHWKGITVVGDVHGDLTALTTALAWAQARNNYVWLLGDVIDYGPDTLAAIDLTYRAVMAGHAALVIGNHERKIARWLDRGQKSFRLNEGNRVTVQALERLTPTARRQWIGRFRSLLGHAVLMQHIRNTTLVHAAAHPSLWTNTPDPEQIEQYALYGEGEQVNGAFRRVRHWIDAVPKGQTVFVGHDMIAPLPIIMTGATGGRVVHLDTGCGNGGQLSSADLRFADTGLELECFNRH